jgi:hypothetical protein
MKNQKKYLWLLLSLALWLVSLSAQNNTRDAIYLKNGSIIKGSIIEMVPAGSVKIQVADGSIFVYAMAEVEKIEKEPVSPSSPHPSQATKEVGKPKISIYGGVAIPVGDFAKEKEMNWNAKTGIMFGIQYTTGEEIGFLISGSYASNATSYGGISSSYASSGTSSNWESILVLTGLKIETTNSSGVGFIFAPLFGFHVSVSPTINYALVQPAYEYYTAYYNMTMESVTSTSAAYGALMEINVGRATIGARYIASKPTYKISVSYSGMYSYSSINTISFAQNMSFIQMYVGIAF